MKRGETVMLAGWGSYYHLDVVKQTSCVFKEIIPINHAKESTGNMRFSDLARRTMDASTHGVLVRILDDRERDQESELHTQVLNNLFFLSFKLTPERSVHFPCPQPFPSAQEDVVPFSRF
jgi:hypothetical protein